MLEAKEIAESIRVLHGIVDCLWVKGDRIQCSMECRGLWQKNTISDCL